MANTKWLALALVVLASSPAAAADVATGNPNIQSIEAISFGPDGLLLIGDGKGGQIVAVQTGDTTPIPWQKADIADLRAELGGRLGTNAQGIEILKLAVNPASHTAYFAVRKLKGKSDLLLTLDGNGKVRDFSLDNVKYTRYSLATDEKVALTKVTDLTQAGDRILVAAIAKDAFAARILSIDTRAKDPTAACFSTETFHVAHNAWETRAPIHTVIPYELGGKKFVVGAFTCTPIVKYALDDLKSGEKVKGQSIIELGAGNTPLDMFTYEKGGKTYILMNTFRFHHKQNPVGPSPYWAVKVDHELLKESQKVNKDALQRVAAKASESKTDRAVVADEYHGVMHMDRLDRDRALVIRTNDKGGLSLAVLTLP